MIPVAAEAVDVVLATRNRPEMLRQAVAAVVDQDYPGEVRCLVVYDRCEPDHDVASLADGRPRRSIQVLSNERTGGLAGARNTGILAGDAPLVAFCDDDDFWEPDKLSAQLATLAANPASRTCVTGIVVEYDDHSVTRVPTPEDLSIARLVRRRVMEAHPSSFLVRREALLSSIGLVDEDIPGSYGEDYDWILRAAADGPIAVADRPLVHVRWGSSQFSRQWQTIIDALDYLITKHPAFRASPRAHARILGQQAFAMAASRQPGALARAAGAARRSPREPRAWLAGAVALRVVSAERVMDLANRQGRGI